MVSVNTVFVNKANGPKLEAMWCLSKTKPIWIYTAVGTKNVNQHFLLRIKSYFHIQNLYLKCIHNSLLTTLNSTFIYIYILTMNTVQDVDDKTAW